MLFTQLPPHNILMIEFVLKSTSASDGNCLECYKVKVKRSTVRERKIVNFFYGLTVAQIVPVFLRKIQSENYSFLSNSQPFELNLFFMLFFQFHDDTNRQVRNSLSNLLPISSVG